MGDDECLGHRLQATPLCCMQVAQFLVQRNILCKTDKILIPPPMIFERLPFLDKSRGRALSVHR